MRKTTRFLKKEDFERKWYVVDAKDKILGRVASRIAAILKGKTKPGYTPHVDCGDFVVVINASQIKVTGNKLTQRVYRRYSGYPGGLREVRMDVMLAKKPETVIKLAVKRMLPYGPLARRLIKKLKVYAADKHPHSAQQPEVIKL